MERRRVQIPRWLSCTLHEDRGTACSLSSAAPGHLPGQPLATSKVCQASWYIYSEKIGVVRFHKPLVDNQIGRLDEQERQIYCTLRLDPVCLDQLACRMHLT